MKKPEPHTDSKDRTLLFLLWNTNWLMLTAVHSFYLIETELRWNLLMFRCRERSCSASLTVGSCKLGASFFIPVSFTGKQNLFQIPQKPALMSFFSWMSFRFCFGAFRGGISDDFPTPWVFPPLVVVCPAHSSLTCAFFHMFSPHVSSQFITPTLLFVSPEIESII